MMKPHDEHGSENDTNGKVIHTMKRRLGLWGGIGFTAGVIVGSGIFISPKGVIMAAKSPGLTLLIWGLSGLISMFGALAVAELMCIIPSSYGEYMYLRITYAKWIGFLYGWNSCFLRRPSSEAVIALTCAEYIIVPLYDDGCGKPPDLMIKLTALAVVVFLTGLNSRSVRWSSRIQIIFTVAKAVPLVIIVVAGIVRLAQGHTYHLSQGFSGSSKDAGDIIMAFYYSMFAYEGWSMLSNVTEELINPARTMPLTIYLSLPLIIVLYVMANVSYMTVMSPMEILQSPAVAITWAQTVLPSVPWLMPVCVALSTFGAVNGSIFSAGRIVRVIAREREMPQVLSYVHYKWQTPIPSATFNMLITTVYLFAGDALSLINFLSFTSWLFTAMSQLAVIILRFTMKDAKRVHKVPIIFPIIVCIFSIALVVVPLVDSPQIEFLYATLLLLASLIFYIPIIVCDKRPGCMRYITQFFQLLMEVCPVTGVDDDKKK